MGGRLEKKLGRSYIPNLLGWVPNVLGWASKIKAMFQEVLLM